jgi:predicted metal-dependent hydrolase
MRHIVGQALCLTDENQMGNIQPSCRSIRLNTELAKKPRHCLEYIIAHEMVHFLDPRHGNRFVSLMDTFMPDWQFRRNELKQYPIPFL